MCNRRMKLVSISITPDAAYPGMWRVDFSDGRLSDMLNLSRAKAIASNPTKSYACSTTVRFSESPATLVAPGEKTSLRRKLAPYGRLTVRSSGYSARGQLFEGAIDGRHIVTGSNQPLLSACRALLAEGVDPAATIAMRHAGREHDALVATVRTAAKLSVSKGAAFVTHFADRFPPRLAAAA
jgi:hypothetical protein